jgi:hypothetical protein
MRRLVVIDFMSLDGVMQGLASPDEDRDGGFERGGWAAPYFDEVQQQAAINWTPTPLAAHHNTTARYVATRTITQFIWPNTERLRGTRAEPSAS